MLRSRAVPWSADDGWLPMWAHGVLAAGVSGGLMAACYWPLNLHALAWIALVPWLIVLPRLSVNAAGLTGVVVGLVFYRVGLAWMFRIHGQIAIMVILVLSVWMALAFHCTRLAMARFSPSALLWAMPLLFTGQEILRSEGLPRLRFAFLAFGYSQAHNHAVAQIASIAGVYGITFILACMNASLAYALLVRTRQSIAIVVAAIGLTALLTGLARQHTSGSPPSIGAACVQAENLRDKALLDLTQQALELPLHPRYIVLPEHTICDFADEHHPMVRGLGRLAQAHGALICVGAHTAGESDDECDYNNVSMLIGPDGRIIGEQAKCVPLPFFMDGIAARTLSVFSSPCGTIGTYVCYDGLFTDIPRRSVAMGAEILLVPNMDAERWPAQERWQHADMARLRSIELRRCAVRANSAGVSQIIDTTGQVLAMRSETQGAGLVTGKAWLSNEKTLFVRGGHLFARVVGIGYLVTILLVGFNHFGGRLRRAIQALGAKHDETPSTNSDNAIVGHPLG